MTESGNKKRRIARIGGMSSGKGTTKLNSEEELMQADCNLVYNIMQSMNKSQNVMSYQQLQELRSKEKPSRNNSDQSSSSKPSSRMVSSKQLKKFFPEKSHPLMAKCQKSMKYLNKNRCIPKPRAHVGSIQRPSQNPISRFQPDNLCNNSTDSNADYQECSMKNKENSKNRTCSEITDKIKKAKTSNSVDDSYDINDFRTESFIKRPKLISDTDSDNDFEQFLRKHNTEKRTRRKSEKNKFKRKKSKNFICAKKITKVTSKTLSESEESNDSEVKCNTLNEINSSRINIDKEFPSKRFQRIVDYEDSDDSVIDTHINDTGTLDYDSPCSPEHESMVNESFEGNISFDDAKGLNTLPTERTSFVPSISSSQQEYILDYDVLKCKIPCYVRIKRDPLLDKRASLLIDNSSITNVLHVPNSFDDEDDCMILSEISTDSFTNRNLENITSLEVGNLNIGKYATISKSFISEASTNITDVHNKELVFNVNSPEPQTETNKSENLLHRKIVQKDEKGTSGVTASRKSLCDTERDECFTSCKTTNDSHKNVNFTESEDGNDTVVKSVSRHMSDVPNTNKETGVYLNHGGATSATETKGFNVQILSVESLSESDIIVLSDDNEGKDADDVPAINEAKESVAEDSDVEVICLDSTIVDKEKCVNGNIKEVLNNETLNKVDDSLTAKPSNSLSRPLLSTEDDCIILDDLDVPNESTCTAESGDKVQENSQVSDLNNIEKTASGNAPDLDKESILKILGTIDFNCINKVLKETAISHIQEKSIPVEVDKTNNIDTSERTLKLCPEKILQSQNDTCLSQKQASIGASITPIGPFEVNKLNSSNIFPVGINEKHNELVQKSNIVSNIENNPKNVSSSKKRNSTHSSDTGNTVCIDSNTNLDVPKFFSEKEIACSHKIQPNVLNHSGKNRQLLPVYTKVESYESPSDELDIIAAKSIQELDEWENESIVPLLELYKAEYKRFLEIKSTEQNVTAGLKLLQEKQFKKLLAISSSIRYIVKKDRCFHKINNEFGSKSNDFKGFIKIDSLEEDGSLDKMKRPVEFMELSSIGSYLDEEDRVKIFNQSVVERASEVLKSGGPSSSQEVYNHLINSVCAECGKHAVAACSGCANIYYCSEKCGMSYWSKGHYATCRR